LFDNNDGDDVLDDDDNDDVLRDDTDDDVCADADDVAAILSCCCGDGGIIPIDNES
jgi:hypothetical protein